MKLDDRNIDQLFRDAAQNKSAPEYHSSFWREVSSALDLDQRRKRGLIFWSIGGSLAFIGILAMMFVNAEGHIVRYSQDNVSQVSIAEHEFTPFSTNNFQKTNSEIQRSSESEGISKNVMLGNELTEQPNKNASIISKSTDSDHNEFKTLNEVESEVSDKVLVIDNNPIGKESIENNVYPVETELAMINFERLNTNDISNDLDVKSEDGFRLSAQVNAGVMENYRTSRAFQSGIMSLGLKASHQKSDLYFASGIGIQVSTNTDLVVSRRAKYYGFGVVNYQTDLSYQNMYDIYVPVEVGYQLGKTSFGMGLQASYLINTSMELSNYEDNELISRERISGYNNGLNKFSAQGYLWLNHEVSQRISLGLRVGTNFTNRIKEGDYFNESSTTNPVFGQISIKYHLFK